MSEFDKSELDRVMRKIKHCLALSASANEHEAATAMRQAQKLMAKYKLSTLDVKMAEVGKADGSPVVSRRPMWDVVLGNLVANAFGCQCFSREFLEEAGFKKRVRVTFVGVSPAQDIAKYAYDALYAKVRTDRLAYIKHLRTLPPEPKPKGRPKKNAHRPQSVDVRGNHFAFGWVCQVQKKLLALVPEADAPSPAEAQALAVVHQQDNELIDHFMSGLAIVEKPVKVRTDPYFVDHMAGKLAGSAAELHHGMGTTGDTPLALGVNR